MSRKMPNSSSSGENNPPAPPRNKFLRSGYDGVSEVTQTKSHWVMRVDMPGCPESDLVYWIETDKIHYFADEPAMPEYGNEGRKYGGTIVINPWAYDVKETKAKLVNGVLWVTVPKIPGRDVEMTVTEACVYWPVTREDVADRGV